MTHLSGIRVLEAVAAAGDDDDAATAAALPTPCWGVRPNDGVTKALTVAVVLRRTAAAVRLVHRGRASGGPMSATSTTITTTAQQ